MDNSTQKWHDIVRVESNGHLADGKILQHLIKDMIQDQGGFSTNGVSLNNESVIQGSGHGNNMLTNNNNTKASFDNDTKKGHERESSNNEQLQSMIDNYRNHVIKQQQQTNNIPNPQSRITNDIYSHFQHMSDPRDENNLIHPSNAQQNNIKVLLSNNNNEAILMRNEIDLLKKQIDILQKKTDKLKQLEAAYSRIEHDFEQILTQREKQEQLEKSALVKMEQQIQRLSLDNEMLQQENTRLKQICMMMEENSKQSTILQSNSTQQIIENCNSDEQVYTIFLG